VRINWWPNPMQQGLLAAKRESCSSIVPAALTHRSPFSEQEEREREREKDKEREMGRVVDLQDMSPFITCAAR